MLPYVASTGRNSKKLGGGLYILDQYSLVVKGNVWDPNFLRVHVQLSHAPVFFRVPHELVILPLLEKRKNRQKIIPLLQQSYTSKEYICIRSQKVSSSRAYGLSSLQYPLSLLLCNNFTLYYIYRGSLRLSCPEQIKSHKDRVQHDICLLF